MPEDKRIDAAVLSREPTLRKAGAHLRWLLEKSGINPERCVISIGVKDEVEKSLMISTFLRDFDGRCMTRHDSHPAYIEVLGVKLVVGILGAKD